MEPFDDRSPIYQQIAEHVRSSILSGDLDEGAQVMSTTAYATTYRINPATAAKAMGLLVDEGLVDKRRGLGMFVASGARERLRDRRRALFVDDVVRPVLQQAHSLDLSTEDLIRALREIS
ncbi:MAG: GntR family transcriptional regulator [Ornithinimicrobium sp.]